MQINEKARESRVRRLAARQGLALRKSRTRNPDAVDYGGYGLVDPERNWVAYGTFNGGRFIGTLDDVEEWLKAD